MRDRLFGWSLPPGCSHRDIENAMTGPDPTPESEQVLEMLGKSNDAIADFVDALANKRNEALELLRAALVLLPPDKARVCTCADEPWQCALHGQDAGIPTLREEITALLKQEKR